LKTVVTPEFDAEYRAALDGIAAPRVETKDKTQTVTAGTLAWLVKRYRETGAWTGLSLATRRQRENILKLVLESAGRTPITNITKATIVAGRDRRAKETPFQAMTAPAANRQWRGRARQAAAPGPRPSRPDQLAGPGFVRAVAGE
jgi:hypothetical protein